MDNKSERPLSLHNRSLNLQLTALYVSTFLLRVGFAGSLILFDWLLVWGIENRLGFAAASDFGPIFLTSFASITFLIAEVMFTGYYGHRSDKTGVKPIILWATFGAAVVLTLYTPAPIILASVKNAWSSIILMVLYLSFIHFLHGLVASGVVSPSLGYINYNSDNHNRSLRMAWYDNAILYGRALGMPLGGLLWLWSGIDHNGLTLAEEANKIARIIPVLSILLIFAGLLIVFGIKNTPKHDEVKPFSIIEDITLSARVMFDKKRRPLLAPWLALSSLIGSISLWGPSIAFRTAKPGENRSIHALIPIIIIIVALALPAPFWGKLADMKGRKMVLNLGLLGLPLVGIGALIGYPFYKNNIGLSNPVMLISIVPGIMLISGIVPVLMGALGDTADKEFHEDGQIMSGYHFIIAMGEIIGILVGGLVIGTFAILEDLTGIFKSQKNALLSGFLLFELVLLLIVIIGTIKIPSNNKKMDIIESEVHITEIE